jgi:hypothetical protein
LWCMLSVSPRRSAPQRAETEAGPRCVSWRREVREWMRSALYIARLPLLRLTHICPYTELCQHVWSKKLTYTIVCDDEQFYKTVETAARMNMTVFCDVARCSLVECEVPSSHGGEYEAQNLLGCTAVFLIVCWPTFQSYVRPDDGGSTDLWNVGRHTIKNTAVHPRRLSASNSPPWELEISHNFSIGF